MKNNKNDAINKLIANDEFLITAATSIDHVIFRAKQFNSLDSEMTEALTSVRDALVYTSGTYRLVRRDNGVSG